MSRRLATILLPLLTAAVMLGLWIAANRALPVEERFLLPSPGRVWADFLANREALLHAAWNTSQGALLGFCLAVAVSFVLAVGLSLSPLIRISFYPYLMILQMTPIIVFAPMLVLWVGPGLPSVTLITFLICFFPLAANLTQGLISPDRNLVELFRMYGASRWQEMWRLRVPSSLPYFFVGLRIAATLAPIGALVGDYTAGSSAGDGGGLGFQTLTYSSHAQYGALLATAAVTCALGFVFVAAVVGLSWFCLHRWHDSYARPHD